MQKILPGNRQRDRNVQNDFQHEQHHDRIVDAQARGQRARVGPGQTGLQQVGEHAAGAQSEQRNRNREKCEVIEEHHGEQPRQRQFQQQRGKAGERQAREKRAFGNFSGAKKPAWQPEWLRT